MSARTIILAILRARDEASRLCGYPCGRPSLCLDSILEAARDVGAPLTVASAFAALLALVEAGDIAAIGDGRQYQIVLTTAYAALQVAA